MKKIIQISYFTHMHLKSMSLCQDDDLMRTNKDIKHFVYFSSFILIEDIIIRKLTCKTER